MLGALGDDDAYLVTELAKGWDDLQAGLLAVRPVLEVIAEDPGLFGRTRDAAALPDAELPHKAHEARDQLADLLAAGDLVGHLPRIRSIAAELTAARRGHLEETRAAATGDLDALRADLAEEAAGLADEIVEPAISARLAGLDASGASTVEQILARRARFAEAADLVRADLDAVRSAGRVVRLDVAAIAVEVDQRPIRSVEALDTTLDAVRARALELLDDGKEVRFT